MLPISVCMIAKNEEAFLDECLKRLVVVFDEIIFVDTGSTDRTLEIANKYTTHIYHFNWVNDFSAARNFSLTKATHDWVLCVDCDEYLTTDPDTLTQFMSMLTNPKKIGSVQRENPLSLTGDATTSVEYISRLFSKSHFHFEGTIHEQVVALDGSASMYQKLPLTFYHMGYTDDGAMQQKFTRNLSLLTKELDEKGRDPYLLFQIGQCYFSIQQYDQALEYYLDGLSFDLNPDLEYVQSMVENYGYCLVNMKRYKEALQLEGIYQDFAKRADFLFLMGLIYMNNAMFQKAIEEFLKSTKQQNYLVEGTNSYRAFYNIGVIYECTGDLSTARKYYSKCGDFAPALERLKAI